MEEESVSELENGSIQIQSEEEIKERRLEPQGLTEQYYLD